MNAPTEHDETFDMPPRRIPAAEGHQVVVRHIEQDGDLVAEWLSDTPLAASNLDQVGPAGRAMVTQAMATADLRTRSGVGHVIDLIGYVAHVAELTNKETGECTRKLRVVLFLADGKTLSTMSAGCIRAIRYIAKQMGDGKWDPPVRVEIREHPLEGGKSYCDLRELEPEKTKEKGGKR